jgi:signal transduction histidine kinase
MGTAGEGVAVNQPVRVLLVEDCSADAELILDELRSSGHVFEFERVDNAGALRTALRSGRWQLIICDFRMPGFDALEALAIVKELRLDLPFIVVSGAVGEETAITAMKAGAHDFVLKDRLARLVPAVERELREAAVRTESASIREQLLLSDRLVQIGTLAAGVAHEINNPLSYVIGNVAYVLEELGGRAAAVDLEVLEALRQALEGAERIRLTTEDLRVFSRTDDGKPHPVDLRRVLESSIGMAWTQIRHRARLVKQFQAVPPIAANENRLGQVFLNLLINAAQAIPEGNAAGQEICVSLRQKGDSVEVEVSDTGLGIAPEMRGHLFEPFFTTKPKDVGTGLGLSICRKIVLDYKGRIDVRANPDRGTTFSVRLPIARVEAANSLPAIASDIPLERGRVLVIDDEPALVDILSRVLRSEHEVVGFSDAREALALLGTDTRFDAIVCDLMMPQLSSAEFYAGLCELSPRLAERVIFMTGGAFTQAAQQFLASVSNPRLQKPFKPRELSSLVRDLIAHEARGTYAGSGAGLSASLA